MIPYNQSGFKPGDSCANQLLSITHEMYQSFDDNLDVRAVVLDIYMEMTYLKYLIRYGIKVLYTNSSKMGYRVIF